MDRLKLSSIIRGAYLNAGCLPFVLSGDVDKGASKLPELRLPSIEVILSSGFEPANRNEYTKLGKEASAALAGLRLSDGSFPAAVRVKGVGDFFCGRNSR